MIALAIIFVGMAFVFGVLVGMVLERVCAEHDQSKKDEKD